MTPIQITDEEEILNVRSTLEAAKKTFTSHRRRSVQSRMRVCSP